LPIAASLLPSIQAEQLFLRLGQSHSHSVLPPVLTGSSYKGMINQIFFSGSVHRLANKIAVADDAAMAVALCKDYNLTGLTLFTDGTFMSVLEGRECDTLTVFKLVKDDPRFTHTNVVMEHGRERAEFTSYRIGFKDARARRSPKPCLKTPHLRYEF